MQWPDNPWDLYWQNGILHSCIPRDAADAAVLDEVWRTLACGLKPDSPVLDLACGNGAVPAAMLDVNPYLSLTAVDLATIVPETLAGKWSSLRAVKFLAGTDMSCLPFKAGSFMAVTSQFGIEYADIGKTLGEAARVLAPGGFLTLVIHHRDSDVLRASRHDLEELDSLLVPGGLVESLTCFVAGTVSLEALEASARSWLGSDSRKTNQISGQVMAGIDRIITARQRGDHRENYLAETIPRRMDAQRERLRQQTAAAVNEAGAEEIAAQLEERCMSAVELQALASNADEPSLLAWKLSAVRG